MLRLSILLIILSTITACATSTPEEEAREIVTVSSNPENITCRTLKPIGSMISKRICKSQEEWDEIEEQSREKLKRGATGGVACNPDSLFASGC